MCGKVEELRPCVLIVERGNTNKEMKERERNGRKRDKEVEGKLRKWL